MKINVPGKTPMERLTNLTRRIVKVQKTDVEHAEKKWRKERTKRLAKRQQEGLA